MPPRTPRGAAALAAALLLAPPAAAAGFEADVLPILRRHCFQCHSGRVERPKADLRLDTAEHIRAASEASGLVVPGKPAESALYRRVARPAGSPQVMPPAGSGVTLSDREKAALAAWIERGADLGEWVAWGYDKRAGSGLVAGRPAPAAADAAAAIDRLVDAGLAGAGVAANPPADDPTFLRRAHLDIAGRIPTAAEASAFLADGRPDRRARLIDALLDSEGFVSHSFHHWADALRARSGQNGNKEGSWLYYLKQSVRENKPYDRWVREMLTAEGTCWEDPAVGYHLRDEKNRFAGYEATVAVFLGTRIGCAQCHDHPYDAWTRKDYFGSFAYFAGLRSGVPVERAFARLDGKRVEAMMGEERDKSRKKQPTRLTDRLGVVYYKEVNEGLRKSQWVDPMRYGYRLPKDYQYEDAKPKSVVRPSTLFGAEAPVPPGGKAPAAFADWLTSPDNPRFALTLANRLWHRAMGRGAAGEPLEVRDPADAPNPQLARHLAQLVVDLKFDVKAFLRAVYNTRAYQRRASPDDLPGGQLDLFPGPVLRRLSAEQLWDSYVALTTADPDAGADRTPPDFSFYDRLKNAATEDELWDLMRERDRQWGPRNYGLEKQVAAKGGVPDGPLRRASELASPAPASHVLRQFGQAERETIDDSWRNPTVPQALALLNGPLYRRVIAPGTPVSAAVAAAAGPADKARAAYLAVLSRRPTDSELAAAAGADADDLVWALLNTREFLFVP